MGDTKSLGKIGVKALLFYLVTTALAISVALTVGHLINPGIGLDISGMEAVETSTAEAVSTADTILNIIPENPIAALANGEMLQVIVFALFVGILIAKLGERVDTVANFFSQFNDVMMEMTSTVMLAAPIGVFCLIAKTFSGIGFSAFLPLAKYMIGVLLALAIQCFGVYQILMKVLTGLNPMKFLKKFAPVMSFAFSTATSNATIPLSIETLDEKLGVSRKVSSFTIPLGATINMDGTAIMQGGGCICGTGVWNCAETGRLCNRYPDSDACFSRNCGRAVSRSGNAVDGICIGRTPGRSNRSDHGNRPYSGYEPYGS